MPFFPRPTHEDPLTTSQSSSNDTTISRHEPAASSPESRFTSTETLSSDHHLISAPSSSTGSTTRSHSAFLSKASSKTSKEGSEPVVLDNNTSSTVTSLISTSVSHEGSSSDSDENNLTHSTEVTTTSSHETSYSLETRARLESSNSNFSSKGESSQAPQGSINSEFFSRSKLNSNAQTISSSAKITLSSEKSIGSLESQRPSEQSNLTNTSSTKSPSQSNGMESPKMSTRSLCSQESEESQNPSMEINLSNGLLESPGGGGSSSSQHDGRDSENNSKEAPPEVSGSEPKQATTSPKSPRVKFRWSGGIRRLTPVDEVSLVLTSLTGTQIPLLWVSNLGWYESEMVHLSCGYHSGFVLVLSKTTTQSGEPIYEERDYKVDSFFVTPHNHGIELFIQSERPIQFWQDIPPLRRRYLSSGHVRDTAEFFCASDGSEAFEFVRASDDARVSQAAEFRRPPAMVGYEQGVGRVSGRRVFSSEFQGRCVSLQDLKSLEMIHTNFREHEQPGSSVDNAGGKFLKVNKLSKTRNVFRKHEHGVDLSQREFSSNLMERLSGTNSITKGGSPTDSSYHSRSRSVFLEDIISENTASLDKVSLTSRSDEGKPSLKVTDSNWLRLSDSNLDKTERDGKGSSSRDESIGKDWTINQQSLIQSRRALSKAELDLITFETEAQIRAVEQLLESSDSDFEDHDEHENILPVITAMFQSIEIDSSSQKDSSSPHANQNTTEETPVLNDSHQSSVLRESDVKDGPCLALNLEDFQLSRSRSILNESNGLVLGVGEDDEDDGPALIECLGSLGRDQTKILLGEAGDAGPFGCVITFESRSTSLDDVGSPRALEKALVSLASNNNVSDDESNGEKSYSQCSSSLPRKSSRSSPEPAAADGEETGMNRNSNVHLPSEDGSRPFPDQLEHEFDSLYDCNDAVNVKPMVASNLKIDGQLDDDIVAFSFDPDDFITSSMMELEQEKAYRNSSPVIQDAVPHAVRNKNKDLVFREVVEARSPNYLVAEASEVEDHNFQYESEDSEGGQFPIDIRGVNSDDSSNVNIRRGKPKRIVCVKEKENQVDHIDVVIQQQFVTKTTTVELVTVEESDNPSRLRHSTVSVDGKRHRSRRVDRRRHSDSGKRGSRSDEDFESGKKLTRSKGKLDLKHLSDQMDTTIESDEDMKLDTKKSSQESLSQKASDANLDFIMCDVTVTPKATRKIMISKDIQCSLSSRDRKEEKKKLDFRTKQLTKKRIGKYSMENARRQAERCERKRAGHPSNVPDHKCFKESSEESDSDRSSQCSRGGDESLTGVSSINKSIPTSDVESGNSSTRSSQRSESECSQLKQSSDSRSNSVTTDIESKSFKLTEKLTSRSEESRKSSFKRPDVTSGRCCRHTKCQAVHRLSKNHKFSEAGDKSKGKGKAHLYMNISTETPHRGKHLMKSQEVTGEKCVLVKDIKKTFISNKCVGSQTSARLNCPSRVTSTTQRTCDKEVFVQLSAYNDNATQTNGNSIASQSLGFSVLPNKFTPPFRETNERDPDQSSAPDNRTSFAADYNLINELTKLEQHFHRLQKVERNLEGIRLLQSPQRRYTNISSSLQGLNRTNTVMSTTSEDERQQQSTVHVHTHEHHHHSSILSAKRTASRSESLHKKVATSLPSSPNLQRRGGHRLHTTATRPNADASSPLTTTKDVLNSHRSTARSDFTTTSSLLQPSFIRKVMSFEPYTTRILRNNSGVVEDFKPYNTNTNITLNRTYSLDSSMFPLAQTHDLSRNYPRLQHHLHSSSTTLHRANSASRSKDNLYESLYTSTSYNRRTSPLLEQSSRKDTEELIDGLRSKLEDIVTDRSSHMTFLDQSLEGSAALGAGKGGWTSHSLGDLRARLTPESSVGQPLGKHRSSATDGNRALPVQRKLRFDANSPHFVTNTSQLHLDPGLSNRHFESTYGRHFVPRAASYSGGLNANYDSDGMDFFSEECGLATSDETSTVMSDCEGSTDCLLAEAERLVTRGADPRKFRRSKEHHQHKGSWHEHHKSREQFFTSKTIPSSSTEKFNETFAERPFTQPFLPSSPSALSMGQLVKVLLPSIDEATNTHRSGTLITDPSVLHYRTFNTPGGNLNSQRVHTPSSRAFVPSRGSDEGLPGVSKRGGGVAVGRVVFVDQRLKTVSPSLGFTRAGLQENEADVVVMLQKEASLNWSCGASNAVVQVPFSKVLLAWPLH